MELFCKQMRRCTAHSPQHMAISKLWTKCCGCSYQRTRLEFADSSREELCEFRLNRRLMRLSYRQLLGKVQRLCYSNFLHMGILLTLSAGEWWNAWENKYSLLLLLVMPINHNSYQHGPELKAFFQGWLWDASALWTHFSSNDTEENDLWKLNLFGQTQSEKLVSSS